MSRPKSKELTDGEYEAYFNSHVKEDIATGCYLWTAAKNNIGYGMFRFKNGMATAHRVRMALDGHDIEGKIVHHTCDNYHCVNPAHLVAGTYKDKGASVSNKGRAGTHWTDSKYHKTCEHCGYTGSPAVLGRRHGDKCEHKP